MYCQQNVPSPPDKENTFPISHRAAEELKNDWNKSVSLSQCWLQDEMQDNRKVSTYFILLNLRCLLYIVMERKRAQVQPQEGATFSHHISGGFVLLVDD